MRVFSRLSRLGVALVASLLLLAPAAATATAEQPQANAADSTQGPVAVVNTLTDGLLDIMKRGESLGYDGRAEAIRPVILDTFDLDAMARVAIGRTHWRALDADQKDTLTDAFRTMTVSNYASNFDSYSGQSFAVDSDVRSLNDKVVVKTAIERPNKDSVSIHYVLHERDGQWRIIDILLDGSISQISRYRSEFSAVFDTLGYDGLLTAMRVIVPDGAD